MTEAAGSLRPSALIDWGVAERPLYGERESGDLHLVEPFPDGVLVTVMDGLGHGPEAAQAASAAACALRPHAHEPILDLIRRCHDGTRLTRGLVLGIASFRAEPPTITWAGVGNIDGAFFHWDDSGKLSRNTLVSRSGVVGYQLPPLHQETHEVAPGDVLILATDGIASGAFTDVPADCSPRDLAHEILRRFGKNTDDALVLVVRFMGTEK